MTHQMAADWMAHIRGDVRLTELAIPGTHDTMTSQCEDPYYRTQNLSLSEQLETGVRFVDLRLTRNMVAAHREWISTITFNAIHRTLADFLHNHPGETVLARIQNANEAKDDYGPYAEALKASLANADGLFHYFGSTTNWPVGENPPWPALDQVRGRVVAIECSPPDLGVSCTGSTRWAADWHGNPRLRIQDDWDGPTVEDKLAAIGAMARPNQAGAAAVTSDVLLLNHISATNGVPGNPLGYAKQLNPAATGLLVELAETNHRDQCNQGTGVYIFDFIDPTTAETTISVNNLVWRS